MNNQTSCSLRILRLLLITPAGLSLIGCAGYVGQETTEYSSITRVESSTPAPQWPVKDPYIVNHSGKIQVIPDERYEPRPSKK